MRRYLAPASLLVMTLLLGACAEDGPTGPLNANVAGTWTVRPVVVTHPVAPPGNAASAPEPGVRVCIANFETSIRPVCSSDRRAARV